MKLTPFHKEIARRVAEGQPNREILKHIKISASRLSVLKGDPAFKAEVARYTHLQEVAYERAVHVLAEHAEEVAREWVRIATDPNTPAKDRADACLKILDRVRERSALAKGEQPGGEMVFEQRLKIVRSFLQEAHSNSQDAGGDEENNSSP